MIKERPQADEKDQLIAALQQQLAQEQHENTQLKKKLNKLEAYQNTVHKIVTNKDMTYSDRVLWIITLDNHPNELLACKPFQPNVSRLRQESGVGSDTTTKFFASMVEAGGIKYSNKAQQDEHHNYSSVSTVIPMPDHAQANTRAATLRIKQREETTKRRMARKLIIQPCPECGSESLDDAYSAIVPICKHCNHVDMDRQETVPAKNVRIIEEEIIPPTGNNPSHEFSEVTDHEWEEIGNDDESASSTQEPIAESPSHEFSEASNSTEATDPDHEFSETPNGNTPDSEASTEESPSHEFSETPDTTSEASTSREKPAPKAHKFKEGMTVNTPHGIGIISIISTIHNKQWCRVRYPVAQPDGTFYQPFELHQIQPIVQATLEERS